jgi:bacterioferritin-associated ferredoxin
MIVCLCHRITDRDIARAVESGTTCFEALQDDTRVGSSCGCCQDCAREVFDDARARLDAGLPTSRRVITLAAVAG